MSKSRLANGDIVKELRRHALRRNVDAMWILGEAYGAGFFESADGRKIRLERNLRLSRKWLRRASDAGCSGAMLSLAAAYTNKPSYKALMAALKLEKQAWQLGESLAANNIAVTYSFLGKKKLCHRWLKKSYQLTGDGLMYALSLATGYGVGRNVTEAMKVLDGLIARNSNMDEDGYRARSLRARILQGNLPSVAIPITRTNI